MPDGGSDYEGWPFDGQVAITCPDCDKVSPECDYLHDLLNWVDRHILVCTGYGTDFEEAANA